MLYPTYRASTLEQKEQALKNSKDSVALADFYKNNGEALIDAKKKRIKLGLDLRGGMYVTLEADVVKLIEESAQKDAVDDIFIEILDKTRKEADASEESALDIFLRNFDAIARPKGRSLISYFEVSDMKTANEDEIKKKLKANVEGAIDQAAEVIRQRIDKYGVAEPTIQKIGSRRIVLELPGVQNEGEVRQLLQTTARLEFKLVRNNAEIVRAFFAIDKFVKAEKSQNPADTTKALAADTTKKDTTAQAVAAGDTTKKDSSAKAAAAKDTTDPYAGLPDEERKKRYQEDHPFSSLFITYFINNEKFVPINYLKNDFPEGEYFFKVPGENLDQFQKIIAKPAVRHIISTEYQICVSAKPDAQYERQGAKVFDFFNLKAEPELTGDVITEAVATFDPTNNQPEVLMDMNADGSERWARITGANIKKKVAIVLDERVYSAPTVQNKITGGRSQITGSSTIDEARLLQIVLKAGALKAPVKIIEERVVGPSLGEDSIRSGFYASLIAFFLVVLFMAIYYSTAGMIADAAVMINVLLVLSLLAAFNGTLTLPGIGGIILTIGMAVDANILIYERVREELRHGRTLRAAIDEGFHKALSAILDSNICTFVTGIILFYFGTGPVQGFALTLMIGILMTLFTGLLVSRAIINMILSRGATSINFG